MSRNWMSVAATALVIVVAGSAAHAAGDGSGVIVTPDRGARGTGYEVSVRCVRNPGLSTRVLDGSETPGTIPPIDLLEPGAVAHEGDRWVYRTTAGPYDALYWANCGDATESGRFDTELPHLLLGPQPSFLDPPHTPLTDLEGSDCPAGTKASIKVTADRRTTTATTTIDRYGDWVYRLPILPGSKPMTISASCGSVRYPPLAIPADPVPTDVDAQLSIVRLYRAYFQRTPAGPDLLYWATAHHAGRTLGTISEQFARSSEFRRRYGTLSDGAFVDRVFANVFGRPPDPKGRAYWVGVLRNGRPRGLVMVGFSESLEFRRITRTV